MHISVEPRDEHAILHLRGEFDTFYVTALQQEIDALVKQGVVRIVLNLRLVRYINSTALGALARIRKQLEGKGGKVVVSRPSSFVRDMLTKVGLDRVLGIYDSDEAAAEAVTQGLAPAGKASAAVDDDQVATVLFSPVDTSRIDHFLPESGQGRGAKDKLPGSWSGAGRMSAIDANGLRFTWNGSATGLTPFAMGQFLALGTEWRLKFRLPMMAKGYREAVARVTEVEERPEGVKVGTTFQEMDDATRSELQNYVKDLAYLKDELKRATDR
ncbi:MAG: anti-sigma factor antagonist [Planctomycetes bacterium]|nr:anti-sigma factor antagonist [Planctomycetota bacterium]